MLVEKVVEGAKLMVGYPFLKAHETTFNFNENFVAIKTFDAIN